MNGLFEELSDSGAEISDDGLYRYTLTREWADGTCVGFLMFNPSTADASQDDPTIRKCVGFAKRWGYSRLVVLNLYAIRSRDPKAVGRMGPSAVGPLNDFWITKAMKEAREIICAWGCAQHSPDIDRRIQRVMSLQLISQESVKISCLGRRQDNHPRHPLMLSYDTPREPFVWRSK